MKTMSTAAVVSTVSVTSAPAAGPSRPPVVAPDAPATLAVRGVAVGDVAADRRCRPSSCTRRSGGWCRRHRPIARGRSCCSPSWCSSSSTLIRSRPLAPMAPAGTVTVASVVASVSPVWLTARWTAASTYHVPSVAQAPRADVVSSSTVAANELIVTLAALMSSVRAASPVVMVRMRSAVRSEPGLIDQVVRGVGVEEVQPFVGHGDVGGDASARCRTSARPSRSRQRSRRADVAPRNVVTCAELARSSRHSVSRSVPNAAERRSDRRREQIGVEAASQRRRCRMGPDRGRRPPRSSRRRRPG